MNEIAGIRLLSVVRTHGETTVYRGERVSDGAILAIKTAKTGTLAARRLEHEAMAYRSVVSRRTVSCAEFGTADDLVYLALHWYADGSLKDRLKKGRLTSAETFELARELLAALHDIHKAGLIHRDVKPSNIFFDDLGEARLGDFGIALLKGEKPILGCVVGTEGYLSPEQAAGTKIDARVDLYALGVVLKESVGETTVVFRRFLDDLTNGDRALRPRSAAEALARLSQIIAR